MALPHTGRVSGGGGVGSRLTGSAWDSGSNPASRVLSGEVCIDFVSRLLFRAESQAALMGNAGRSVDDGEGFNINVWLFAAWSWFACYGPAVLFAMLLLLAISVCVRTAVWYERDRRWRKIQQQQQPPSRRQAKLQ